MKKMLTQYKIEPIYVYCDDLSSVFSRRLGGVYVEECAKIFQPEIPLMDARSCVGPEPAEYKTAHVSRLDRLT